ncbi:MAG: biotin/lipoyl-binding protein [Clostridiales bacterium]|nr:biotin/lipoyl-binding protein [Clostridiales bacterium]
MRKFMITVDGKSYEVEVEEIGQEGGNIPQVSSIQAPATNRTSSQRQSETPAKAQAPKVAPAPKVDAKPIQAGAEVVKAPMPGTILDVKVKPGDEVKRGDVLAILEAMKMENEIMAPRDAIIASVQVTGGTAVNAGDALIALE